MDSINEDGKTGYILEVDLEYPSFLQDIVDRYGIKVGGVKKLIPNLNDEVKYVVHTKNLLCYLSLGMKLVKIHRILKFKQKDWLKSYTDFNSKKED